MISRLKLLAAVGVVGANVAFATGAQASIVQNGDFTSLTSGLGQLGCVTNATGWSPNGGCGNSYIFVYTQGDQGTPGVYGSVALWDAANGGNNSWNGLAANGGNFAALDSDFQVSALTQQINGLAVGHEYTLDFNYAFGQQYGFDGPTIQGLMVAMGGATVFDIENVNVASHGFTGWSNASVTFTATSASELLSFLADGNIQLPPFALVSNVSINGVPEPATLALFGAGLAGAAAIRRRRKSGKTAANDTKA